MPGQKSPLYQTKDCYYRMPTHNHPNSVTTRSFEYGAAFARNIGWVTETEQHSLAGKRIAIAGLGGVGGFHLLTLARLGVGSFNIADSDRFELANLNRQ